MSLTGNLPGPPGVTVNPQTETAYVGQTSIFIAVPSGSAPFSYQWSVQQFDHHRRHQRDFESHQCAAIGLRILQRNVEQPQRHGIGIGELDRAALPPPATAQILANNPLGYWRLNETTGPTVFDSAENFNGTGEGGLTFGVPGVTNAPFTGFESGNLAAQFNGTDSDVSIPAFNVTTTNFTITGWIKCNGAQISWSGVVFGRSGGRGTGLMVANNGSRVELRYSWNDNGADYNHSTGLFLPPNGLWAFIALTIEPTRAIVYLATNSVLKAATNNVTNTGQTFNGSFYFGYDPNDSTRRINGTLDEIAIYNLTLSTAQISQILAAAQQSPPSVVLPTITNVSLLAGGGFSLNATATTGQTCILLGTTNLSPPVDWSHLETNTADANGMLNFTDVPATHFAQRFYRLTTQ